MTQAGVYLSFLSVVLAVPLGMALRTLLALKERVIVPLLRIQVTGGATQAITMKWRPLGARPPELNRSYAVTAPARFTQPKEGGHDHRR
jgi:hypothetical protein